MAKFKIGDRVKFHREWMKEADVPDLWSHLVDTSKVYTVTWVSDNGALFKLDDGYDFLYHYTWLEKVDDSKFHIKVREGRIKDVKFSGPATIVFWTDGTKTVVKCRKGDKFDPEKGIAMACAKKLLGNEDGYHGEIAKYAKPVKKSEPPKDTEELRFIVNSSCIAFPRCDVCPCRLNGGDGDCHIIAFASREVLLEMYHSFERAGKLWKGGERCLT